MWCGLLPTSGRIQIEKTKESCISCQVGNRLIQTNRLASRMWNLGTHRNCDWIRFPPVILPTLCAAVVSSHCLAAARTGLF